MVVVANNGFSDYQTFKVTTNNVFLCDPIVLMSQLPTKQCMHSSQLQCVTQLAGVFTHVVARLNFTNAMELSQFRSNIAFNQLNNVTKFEPSQLDLQMCLAFQDIECITNVNWPIRNLNQELALMAMSQSTNYTQFDAVQPLAIDDVQ